MKESMIYPNAVVASVYPSDHELRGWVVVNIMGLLTDREDVNIHKYDRDAVVVASYGFKPTTEEAQASATKTGTLMNQQYGFISYPRRGDRVVLMRAGRTYYVLGSLPAIGGNEPPISSPEAVSIIHRSGASLRFNDRYPGVTGGSDEYDGITGNTMLVSNRGLVLVGSRFLPFGLLAEHATQTAINIDLNDDEEGGYTFGSIFDNADPVTDYYYDPWADTIGAAKLLSPPDSVGADTLFILHQGGGLFKMEPLATDYSGAKIAVGGFTISVGKKYWDAGLKDSSTSTTAHADTQSTDPVDSVIRIQMDSGAYIEMDASGNVVIESAGTIKLGTSATQAVVGAGDDTSSDPVDLFWGIVAPPHSHTETSSQSEVLVP